MKSLFQILAVLSFATLISCADDNSGFAPGSFGDGDIGLFNDSAGLPYKGACDLGVMCVETYSSLNDANDVCNYTGTKVDRCPSDGLVAICKGNPATAAAAQIQQNTFFYTTFGMGDLSAIKNSCAGSSGIFSTP